MAFVDLTDEINKWKSMNKYYTHVNNFSSGDKNFINVLYLNIRSIRNKLNDVEFLISTLLPFDTGIVVLTETWLRDYDNQFYNIQGFKSFHSTRDDGYGGCSIFVREQYCPILLHEENQFKCNFLVVQLAKLKINIIAIYRPPNINIRDFVIKLEALLLDYRNSIIFGDFNINLLNIESDTTNYVEMLACNGYFIVNEINELYATRVSNSISTIIDHVITDLCTINYEFHLDSYSKSDHKLIYFRFEQTKQVPRNNELQSFDIIDYTKVDRDNIWNNLEKCENFEDLSSEMSNLISRCSDKVKRKSVKKFKRSWMTDEIFNIIKLREKFYKLKLKCYSKYCEEKYQYYNNLSKERIKLAKIEYFRAVFDENISNPKLLWKIFNKEILNKHTENSKFELEVNKTIISEDLTIANTFNEYFSNIAHDTIQHLHYPNEIAFNYIQYNIQEVLNLENIETAEISNIIKNLKKRSSTGHDKISSRFLMKNAEKLKDILAKLSNNAIKNQTVSSSLKLAKIIPIHKKGSKTEIGHYRPISIPTSFAKIFENIIYTRMEKFLEANGVIAEYQFGFTKNSNTTAACLNLTNNISTEIEKGKCVSVLFLDLCKAFDTVNHKLLLLKLKKMQIGDDYLKLFENYLSNRTQFVQINITRSEIKSVNIGVPQGSILGPMLFKIFINDIMFLNLHGKIQIYADDIAIVYSSNDIANLFHDMQSDMNTLNEWFHKNLLLLNTSKTKYLIFSEKNTAQHILKCDQEVIERVSSFTYLGLVIDQKLKWTLHIEHIKKKILPYIFILNKSKTIVPQKFLINIYYAYIHSQLVYLNPIWSGTHKFMLEELFILQKKAVKSMLNLPIRTSTNKIFKKFLSLNMIVHKELILLTHKVITNSIRHSYTAIRSGEVHNYNIRRRSLIRRPKFTTNISNNSVMYRGLALYNVLPIELRHGNNRATFKLKLKQYIFNTVSIIIPKNY